jgi:carbamate kinase
MRVLVALGGNAMTGAGGSAAPQDQVAAIERAAQPLADLVASGIDLVLTHGNGPQVGNLLVKNEIAASVVPPVPLDWCGAQTQATIGFVLVSALEATLRERNVQRRVAAVVTRCRVNADDPAFARPSKPIGRYLPEYEAKVLIDHGQSWEDRGERGWRRVVPSPEPLEVVDAPAARALADAGYVVVANGGGGVPVVRAASGELRGVEAVIDKDLGAVVLARAMDADVLVIATDVDAAILGFGTAQARRLGRVSVAELRSYAADGHFASGSMGPKVEAACRFVERGGSRSVITSLERIAEAVHNPSGLVGTVVVA